MSNDIPTGWVVTTLDKIVDIVDYEREPVNAAQRDERIKNISQENLFPYYGATGQVGWIDDFRSEGVSVLLGEDGAPFLDPIRDKAFIVRGRYWVNNHAHILRGAMELVDNRFICYQLNIVDYQQFVSGSTRLKLTKSAMKNIPLLLAPQNEQIRIVEKLEELLSDLDAGVAELKAAQKKLIQYRQSLLKAAVEGELTAEWRAKRAESNQPVETGAQLLERILKERRKRWEEKQLAKFEEQGKKTPKNWQAKYPEPVQPDTTYLPELPDGWVWASVDQLLEGIEAGKSFKCEERPPKESEYGVVKVSAVTWGEYRELESKTCVTSKNINDKLLINSGDFLFSRANTTELVGACVIAKHAKLRVMLSDKILRLVFVEKELNGWLLLNFRSQRGREQIEQSASGNQASMKNISQRNLRGFVFPLPPLVELKESCKQHMAFNDEFQAQMIATNIGIKKSDAQKKNILKSAFLGELVPQNPTDEPATVVLGKIRAEREDLAKKPKVKKTRAKKNISGLKKVSLDSIKIWVSNLEENVFSFEELHQYFNGDYDILKNEFHKILSDDQPIVVRFFDKESGSIKFRRVES